MVKQRVSNAPYDKTRNVLVVGYDTDTNKYTIIVDGVQYTNVPIVSGLMAQLNDVVKVKIPTNNSSQLYIEEVSCMDTVSIRQDPLLYLDVTIITETGLATSGSDMKFYNKIVSLGWADDVII